MRDWTFHISPFDNSLAPHAKMTDFVIECLSFYEEVFVVKRESSVAKKITLFYIISLFSNYLNIFPRARCLVDTKCYVC